MRLIQYLAAATVLSLSPAIHAQDADPAPYDRGFFVSPMASFFSPDSDRDLDAGVGATIGFGYRFGGIRDRVGSQLGEPLGRKRAARVRPCANAARAQ